MKTTFDTRKCHEEVSFTDECWVFGSGHELPSEDEIDRDNVSLLQNTMRSHPMNLLNPLSNLMKSGIERLSVIWVRLGK